MKLVSALVGLAALGGVALSSAAASAIPVAVPGQAASFQRSAGCLRLQRIGPLLAPTDLRLWLRLLPTRIIMEVGVGTIAGDTGTAGTTGTITIAAGDMADTTGITGNSEERGFGLFLSSPPRLNRRPHRGQRRRTRRRDDRTTSGPGWLISCLRASRSKPPVRIGSPCRAPAPAP
jgi:hypothetical protein